MGYIHIMAYCGLKAMPNVSVHPDGYMVDQHGEVVKRAICPIPGNASSKLFAGLTPGTVYEFKTGMRIEMCTQDQRQNFMEALAEFTGYKPISEPGELFQHPYTKGAYAQTSGRYWELITLTSNRVIIGSVIAEKLAREFIADARKAKAFDEEHGFDGGFHKQFLCWAEALNMAADDGLISIY